MYKKTNKQKNEDEQQLTQTQVGVMGEGLGESLSHHHMLGEQACLVWTTCV